MSFSLSTCTHTFSGGAMLMLKHLSCSAVPPNTYNKFWRQMSVFVGGEWRETSTKAAHTRERTQNKLQCFARRYVPWFNWQQRAISICRTLDVLAHRQTERQTNRPQTQLCSSIRYLGWRRPPEAIKSTAALAIRSLLLDRGQQRLRPPVLKVELQRRGEPGKTEGNVKQNGNHRKGQTGRKGMQSRLILERTAGFATGLAYTEWNGPIGSAGGRKSTGGKGLHIRTAR